MDKIEKKEPLNNNVQYIKGVGPKKAQLLKKLDIETIYDLLTYFPKGFIELKENNCLSDLEIINKSIFIKIKVIEKSFLNSKRGSFYIKGVSQENIFKLLFFNRDFYYDRISLGDIIFIYGKFKRDYFSNSYSSSNFKIIPEYLVKNYKFLPYYSLTKNLTLFNLINIIKEAFKEYYKYIKDIIPNYLKVKYNLPSFFKVLYKMHFPDNLEEYRKAKEIFAYLEFLIYMIQIYLKKRLTSKIKVKRNCSSFNLQYKFIKNLNFNLTKDQIKVINELNNDYKGVFLINRLIQGDVGSGKTIVSFAFLLNYIENDYQVAFMAPTEILATQHYQNFINFILKSEDLKWIKVELLTSSTKNSERNKIIKNIKEGFTNLIFGTHSIIQNDVVFKNLKLIIIDEQQKFGVHQRLLLRNKGENVDLIVLTATPIPRSFNLTIYGDLDISIIKEKPEGRKKVLTYLFKKSLFDEAIKIINDNLIKGGKGFFIYPVIEEDNLLELDSAKENFLYIKNIFSNYKVELIHGKMKEDEVKQIIDKFKNNRVDILVSTTIVSVGIDIPDATFIVIEEAQQFGLSTLHQLRGRIGRGDKEGVCILISDDKISDLAYQRLKKIVETDDGFEISEFDLKLRGPGEIFGEKQSGKLEFKVADIIEHSKILKVAANDAKDLIEKYPELDNDEVKNLKEFLINYESFDPYYLLSG
ncbi:MAG: ATP-dependent DNA helicase RecG [Spirochaetes bacterium]|nr:ATP-dependent DNA helicase RecG [Spirochaetota bacterium]